VRRVVGEQSMVSVMLGLECAGICMSNVKRVRAHGVVMRVAPLRVWCVLVLGDGWVGMRATRSSEGREWPARPRRLIDSTKVACSQPRPARTTVRVPPFEALHFALRIG